MSNQLPKFNNIISEIKKNLFKEGGNAIPNVSKISQQNVQATINDIKQKIFSSLLSKDIINKSLIPIGSTGKKNQDSFSGDLDLAFDLSFVDQDKSKFINQVIDIIETKYKSFDSVLYINDVMEDLIHFGFPITNKNNKQKDKLVQVDILFTNNIQFTKFYMFSPHEGKSQFKGAHRNALIEAIAKNINYNIISDDSSVERNTKWKINEVIYDGYYTLTKSIVDQDTGDYIKDDNDKIIEEYKAINIQKELITEEVDECIQLLFGDNYKQDQLDTFEQIYNIITKDKKFKYYNDKQQILTYAAADLYQKLHKLKMPKQLIPYISYE